MGWLVILISFLISWLVSALIIYAITALFEENKGGRTALVAALAGALIYGLVYLVFGNGLLAAVLGGIGWVVALAGFYKIRWLKAAVIALFVWLLAMVVSWFLPVYLPLA